MFLKQIQYSIYLLKSWKGNFKLALSVIVSVWRARNREQSLIEFYSRDFSLSVRWVVVMEVEDK